jgi:hypothetical protein
MGGASTS